MTLFFRTFFQHFNQLASSEYINTGGYCMGMSHHRLFLKFHNSGILIHTQYAESAYIHIFRHIFAYDCNIRFLFYMIIQYLVVIQFINAVSCRDDHVRFMTSFQEIDILINRIRSAPVPKPVVCGQSRCKHIQSALLTAEIPPFGGTQMFI